MGGQQSPLEDLVMNDAFGGVYSGKRVLVTGHTGFKGAWLSLWLRALGAKVTGLSLSPNTEPSLFEQLGLARLVDSRLGDVRDGKLVEDVMRDARPEFVFHLAAQPLVRLSYERPVETFATNVVGTANILEAARKTDSVRVCQVITTDKCYENRETGHAYREEDRLGGRDPYSSSKACAELVVSSYRESFFEGKASISSARAGNVIGGGDWALDRLIPDCVRALKMGQSPVIRNPRSVRPWQHVLEPLSGYLRLAELQRAEPKRYGEAWNFGPSVEDALPAEKVARAALEAWGGGQPITIKESPGAPHEAGLLKLDSAKARERLGWRPVWRVEEAIEKTIAWYRESFDAGFDARSASERQIQEYTAAAGRAGLSWAPEMKDPAGARA